MGIYSNIAPFNFSLNGVQTMLSDPKNLLTQTPQNSFKLIGSGTFFNPNKKQILTAAHVVSNSYAEYKAQMGEDIFDVEVTHLDLDTDIAVLQISTNQAFENIYPLFPTREAVKIGTNIVSFGYQTEEIQTAIGQISANNQSFKQNENNYFSVINTQVESGNSGGPVMDYAGRLVGINIASKTNEDKAYILPTSKILEVLKK